MGPKSNCRDPYKRQKKRRYLERYRGEKVV